MAVSIDKPRRQNQTFGVYLLLAWKRRKIANI
jgi:hypothetical protein